MARQPAEQTWPEWTNAAVRALSTAVSKSASAKTMFGLFPPSSSATRFTLTAAPRISDRPASMPPVSEMRSMSGESARAWPTRSPGPRTRLTTPGGTPASLEQPRQVDRGQRCQVSRLHHGRAAGGQGRRDLPGQLEERVVPRSDEPAHPDRLVGDAADGSGDARVDDSTRLVVGDVRVVAEDAHDIGDVGAALAHGLARVDGLLARQVLEVTLEQTRDAVQERGTLAGRRPWPVGRVERSTRRRDRRLDLLIRRDIDLGQDRAVARVDDRTARPVA